MASVDRRHTVELGRNLGFFDATMIGVGAMIGAGIFVLTGMAVGRADLVVEEARSHDLVIHGMRGEPLLRTCFFGALAHDIATRVECPSVLTKTAPGPRRRMRPRVRSGTTEAPLSE